MCDQLEFGKQMRAMGQVCGYQGKGQRSKLQACPTLSCKCSGALARDHGCLALSRHQDAPCQPGFRRQPASPQLSWGFPAVVYWGSLPEGHLLSRAGDTLRCSVRLSSSVWVEAGKSIFIIRGSPGLLSLDAYSHEDWPAGL